ncbi:MAG: glucose-6-phosphate isomerase [Planctomycetota bacterium]|nr:MAG: glucose-6-phosphate isomerase [Planctomycetota bacterium]REJ89171.1 MAG: glucose-6-phosphate isomerase [Planctomycetota bacterium]
METLIYDPTATLRAAHGLAAGDVARLAPELEKARAEVLGDLDLLRGDVTIPAAKQPLDAAFLDLPDRLLAEYEANRAESELGKILAAANQLADQVDRVVLLGIGGSYMGARALFDACCHPYHNELSRAERGGRPRLYFDGNNVDNDATSGLRELLSGANFDDLDQRWAIAVISKSGGTLETALSLRTFLTTLRKASGLGEPELGRYVLPVTGASGRLFDLAKALGCADIFRVPDGVGGRFSVLSAVGLLPAAILGLNVVELLRGAAAMNRRFRESAPGDNPVLDYVAICHLMEKQRAASTRVLSVWGSRLEALGLWYDQLLAESLGKEERGALPLTVVNTRDLHSRGQQHQEGPRDKLITNLIVDQVRCDRVTIESSPLDQDQLNALAGKTMPEVMAAAIAGTNQAYAEDGRPTADLHLPKSDEASLGQFFQMMMLATVVEGRLIGINPYGQPGVEAYKRHMGTHLRGGSA